MSLITVDNLEIDCLYYFSLVTYGYTNKYKESINCFVCKRNKIFRYSSADIYVRCYCISCNGLREFSYNSGVFVAKKINKIVLV